VHCLSHWKWNSVEVEAICSADGALASPTERFLQVAQHIRPPEGTEIPEIAALQGQCFGIWFWDPETAPSGVDDSQVAQSLEVAADLASRSGGCGLALAYLGQDGELVRSAIEKTALTGKGPSLLFWISMDPEESEGFLSVLSLAAQCQYLLGSKGSPVVAAAMLAHFATAHTFERVLVV